MDLLEALLVRKARDASSLAGTPEPIVRAVVAYTLHALSLIVPDDTTIADLFGSIEVCEGCDAVILPGAERVQCEDSVVLCEDCGAELDEVKG